MAHIGAAGSAGTVTKNQAAPTGQLDRDATFYVAGHCGLAGSAIVRRLRAAGFSRVIGRTSAELDLTDRDAVFTFFAESKPKYVVLAAAKVGGILANDTYPADFISQNLRIQVNVFDAARDFGAVRLLFLGSACSYPKFTEQPIREESLLSGHLEPTNDAYAVAKIAGIVHVQAVRRQHGLSWISAMPTNLYGPHDNFSETGSHVVPGLIRRYDDAVRLGVSTVTNWGTGSPRRDLLHADDMADACLHLLDHYDAPEPVNIGSGSDVAIRDIAETVASASGYTGQTCWDATKPDGTPRRLLDTAKLRQIGWRPTIDLHAGIESTVAWYRQHRDHTRR